MSLQLAHALTPSSPATAGAAYRTAMSNLAAGVVVVTSWVEGRPWGMTVTSCTSVTDRPPTLLVSLGTATASARAIERDGIFGVSVLDAGQVEVARQGSAPGAPKYLDPRDAGGADRGRAPAVADALAHLDCVVVRRLRVVDHTIFVARARDVRVAACGDPLVYHGRAYHALGGAPAEGGSRRCTS